MEMPKGKYSALTSTSMDCARVRVFPMSKLRPNEAFMPGETLISPMPLVKADLPRMFIPGSKVCSSMVST